MKKTLHYFTYIFLFFVILNACKKDVIIEEDEIIQIQNERLSKVIPDAQHNAFILGVVTDQAGLPLGGVLLTIGDKEVVSDAKGTFSFGEIAVNKLHEVLKAEKSTFFTGFKTFTARENTVNTLSIALMARGTAKTFNSDLGASINLDNDKIKLDFPEDAISKSDGTPYSGTVKVVAKYIDPQVDNFLEIMPGELSGLRANNTLTALESYGMVNVELEDNAGNPLQIASGKKVKVKLPAQASSPAEMPTWHFNEAYGMWVEVGVGVKNGNEYSFEVNHFSIWNLDVPNSSLSATFTIKDNLGYLIPNKAIKIYSAELKWPYKSVYTDSEGKFTVIRAPENMVFEFLFECGEIQQSVSITSQNMDVVIDISSLTNLSSLVFIGKIEDCDLGVQNQKYFELKEIGGDLSFIGRTDNNGNFEISKKDCDDFLNRQISFRAALYLENEITKIDTFDVFIDSEVMEIDFEFCNSSVDTSNFEINFTDENLEAAVRSVINKEEGPILYSDVKNIINLNIDNESITNLEGLQYFDSLQQISIKSNMISDLSPISNLVYLKQIDFSFNSVTNLSPIQDLIQIEWMFLSDNNVSDISVLSNFTIIKNLGLSNNNITDISPLGFLINLESLDLAGNKITTLAALCNLGTTFEGTIDLTNNNPAFTTQQQNDLISCLPNAIILF